MKHLNQCASRSLRQSGRPTLHFCFLQVMSSIFIWFWLTADNKTVPPTDETLVSIVCKNAKNPPFLTDGHKAANMSYFKIIILIKCETGFYFLHNTIGRCFYSESAFCDSAADVNVVHAYTLTAIVSGSFAPRVQILLCFVDFSTHDAFYMNVFGSRSRNFKAVILLHSTDRILWNSPWSLTLFNLFV